MPDRWNSPSATWLTTRNEPPCKISCSRKSFRKSRRATGVSNGRHRPLPSQTSRRLRPRSNRTHHLPLAPRAARPVPISPLPCPSLAAIKVVSPSPAFRTTPNIPHAHFSFIFLLTYELISTTKRIHMRPRHTTLTPQELEIMKLVWQRETATVRDIYEALLEHRKIAYTTVMTMMKILETKGYLKKRRQDRAFIYRPAHTKNQVIGGMLREFIDRVFNGSAEPLLVHLVKTRHIREKDLQKMARLIEEIK